MPSLPHKPGDAHLRDEGREQQLQEVGAGGHGVKIRTALLVPGNYGNGSFASLGRVREA